MRVYKTNATEEMEWVDREFQFYSSFFTLKNDSSVEIVLSKLALNTDLRIWKAAGRSIEEKSPEKVSRFLISLTVYRELYLYCFLAG